MKNPVFGENKRKNFLAKTFQIWRKLFWTFSPIGEKKIFGKAKKEVNFPAFSTVFFKNFRLRRQIEQQLPIISQIFACGATFFNAQCFNACCFLLLTLCIYELLSSYFIITRLGKSGSRSRKPSGFQELFRDRD